MSEDYAVVVPLQDHKLGDEWDGIPIIGPIVVNGVTPALALTKVRCHFVGRESGTVFKISSDAGESPDAPAVIDNATTWEAHIPAVEEFLPSAEIWDWDIEFYGSGKTTGKTYYKGDLRVRDDITKTP